MGNLKRLAILGLHVASLAVGESRVARKDLGMDRGGSGVGLGNGWVVVDEDLVLEQVQVLDPLVAIPVHHLLHLGRVMVLVLG
jgi:hypothetical protein